MTASKQQNEKNASGAKAKGPAPTVEQINADRITQVNMHFSLVTLIYFHILCRSMYNVELKRFLFQ